MWSYIAGGVLLVLVIYFLNSGNTVQYGGKGEQKPSCNLQCPDDSMKLWRYDLC